MNHSVLSGCAPQINFQHCSRVWPPKLNVSPARALRGPQVSQEHQDPKAPWELQATLAGVAVLVTQDPLGCRVLQASKVILHKMEDFFLRE